jgi:ABC-type Fe3+ transport system permease subunit
MVERASNRTWQGCLTGAYAGFSTGIVVATGVCLTIWLLQMAWRGGPSLNDPIFLVLMLVGFGSVYAAAGSVTGGVSGSVVGFAGSRWLGVAMSLILAGTASLCVSGIVVPYLWPVQSQPEEPRAAVVALNLLGLVLMATPGIVGALAAWRWSSSRRNDDSHETDDVL